LVLGHLVEFATARRTLLALDHKLLVMYGGYEQFSQ
jgi:hypothetical protein